MTSYVKSGSHSSKFEEVSAPQHHWNRKPKLNLLRYAAFVAKLIDPLLSVYMGIGSSLPLLHPKSVIKLFNQDADDSAMYSASVLKRASIVCLLDDILMDAPSSVKTYQELKDNHYFKTPSRSAETVYLKWLCLLEEIPNCSVEVSENLLNCHPLRRAKVVRKSA